MHGDSGIILEALNLEDIDIFQNFHLHAGLVIRSIKTQHKRKKMIFTRNDNSRIIGLRITVKHNFKKIKKNITFESSLMNEIILYQ